ncbi:MAG: hypothetical protein JSS49_03175 [Planctomycetes bacterium]|nr:hypothetical protein [Planctomycetota bacterium]
MHWSSTLLRATGLLCEHSIRAIAYFKLGIGCHGYGVLVPIAYSHGLPEDGKTVAPQFENGDGPAFQ